MTETSSVLTYQTVENYAPGSVGRMLDVLQTKVVDEFGKGRKQKMVVCTHEYLIKYTQSFQ